MKDFDKLPDAIETMAEKAAKAQTAMEALKYAEGAQRMAQAYCQIVETSVHLQFHLGASLNDDSEEPDFPLPGETPIGKN